MPLSKIYSNKHQLFEPIAFQPSLNVVIAEIRLPENQDRDTHNLGKTTLAALLDFCFLAKRKKTLFLFKHFSLFKEIAFYIELQLSDRSFVTIRRTVQEPSKVSFKLHLQGNQDFSETDLSEWDHQSVPFDRARLLLDGLLDWRALQPWTFRHGMGYLLRSQDDYRDVFQLRKHAGKHVSWKPFLAHTLGFNASLLERHYRTEEELEAISATANTIKSELGGSIQDISKIEGLLQIKTSEANKKQVLLDEFDFRQHDKDETKRLVDELDESIATLNSERYTYSQSRKRVINSLAEDKILFRPDEAERLFGEAGVVFAGQIKKDYQQLIEFNRAITEERRQYLQEELIEIEAELKRLNSDLGRLGERRSEILSFLSETDVFLKYKQVSDELVTHRADIANLGRQREFLHRLQELRAKSRELTDECRHLQSEIEADVDRQNSNQNSLFAKIRIYFNEIVDEVIGQNALLSVSPNQEGHLEFKAEILGKSGSPTSADSGHTYRKLLCIAFDMAVLRAHVDVQYPRFVFHDGVFETLDDRKKQKLLAVIRRYAKFDIQHIITLIDSDIPATAEGENWFGAEEIVLRLHDEGDEGRLFRMKEW